MSLLSPLVGLLVALSQPQGDDAGTAKAFDSDSEANPTVMENLSAQNPGWEDLWQRPDVPEVHQVRIERRVILRVSPRPGNVRSNMLSDLPRQSIPRRLVERPHGKCVDTGDIVGVSDRGSRLVMYMRDQRIITARLEAACRPRDFYLGFYVEKSEDGRLCVDRDRLMSRAGAKCHISSFKRLELAPGDR